MGAHGAHIRHRLERVNEPTQKLSPIYATKVGHYQVQYLTFAMVLHSGARTHIGYMYILLCCTC